MKFYTLIYVSESEELAPNSPALDHQSEIRRYLRCAGQLRRSLAAHGLDLIVLTNDRKYLESFQASAQLEVRELEFALEVPQGIAHRPTHYKLELFAHLSKSEDQYAALVDCDVLCVNPPPRTFEMIVNQQIALYFDITDQVTPAYGVDAIVQDKELIGREPSFGLWAGGEFIGGPPSFFQILSGEVATIVDDYFRHVSELHQHGDEAVTSVAIERLVRARRVPLADAGALSIVGRYWGSPTAHVQKPLAGYRGHTLLHLPADKLFLSELAAGELQGDPFFDRYNQHLSLTGKRRVGRPARWARWRRT